MPGTDEIRVARRDWWKWTSGILLAMVISLGSGWIADIRGDAEMIRVLDEVRDLRISLREERRGEIERHANKDGHEGMLRSYAVLLANQQEMSRRLSAVETVQQEILRELRKP